MYSITGLGITVGYHRLLTHRAFATSKPVEYAFAIAGCMAVEGPPIAWVADHRLHHAHTDVEGDPHSPHLGEGSGLKGLWHAHTGWLMKTQGGAEFRKYAPDLCEDKGMRWISRNFLLVRRPRPADPVRRGLRPAWLLADSGPVDAAVGRLRADLLHPPCDVVDQLRLPLLRPSPLRRGGQVDERRLACASDVRRVLAPQPSRLPALGAAGARPLRGRPRRRCSSGRSRRSAWRRTSCGSRPERQQEKLVGAKAPAKSTAAA